MRLTAFIQMCIYTSYLCLIYISYFLYNHIMIYVFQYTPFFFLGTL